MAFRSKNQARLASKSSLTNKSANSRASRPSKVAEKTTSTFKIIAAPPSTAETQNDSSNHCGIASGNLSEAAPPSKTTFSKTDSDALDSCTGSRSETATYIVGAAVYSDENCAIYKARRDDCNENLAIHIFQAQLPDNATKQKFMTAASNALRLSHTSILKMIDYGISKTERPFTVTSQLLGTSLVKVLQSEGKISIERSVRIFVQVCDALAYASWSQHLAGDLSPLNIVLSRNAQQQEQATLINIGLNLEYNAELDGMPPSGKATAYASPERCMGQDVDERSTIYTIGCMLYEAISGRAPFEGEDELQVIQKQLVERPKPLFNDKKRRNAPIEALILRCLEKKPSARFQSLNELAAELQTALNREQTKDIERLKDSSASNWATRKDVTVLLEVGIVVFAITIAALGATHSVNKFSSQLRMLKDDISRAQFAPTGSQIAIENWKNAYFRARNLKQPAAVIADLEMNIGTNIKDHLIEKSSAIRSKNFEVMRWYELAMYSYQKEGLSFEATSAASQIINILSENPELPSGWMISYSQSNFDFDKFAYDRPPIFRNFTKAESREYEPLLKYIIGNGLATDPGRSTRAESVLAQIYADRGQWNEAAKLLEDALRSNENPSFLTQWQLAECLKRQNQLVESLKWYGRAMRTVQKSERDDGALLAIGSSMENVLLKLGHKKEARELHKRVVADVKKGLDIEDDEPQLITYPTQPAGYIQPGPPHRKDDPFVPNEEQ